MCFECARVARLGELENGKAMDGNRVTAKVRLSVLPELTARVGQTELTVDELIQHLVIYRDTGWLFSQYPGLEADAIREAIDAAAAHGDLGAFTCTGAN